MKTFLTLFVTISGAFIGFGPSHSFFMAVIGAILFFFTSKIMWIMFEPGKTSTAEMNEKEKETYKFEQKHLKGFSGGFFGQMAIMITNLLSSVTDERGYQNHPTLFRFIYGIITLGVGFVKDNAVNDLLKNTLKNVNNSTVFNDDD